MGPKPTLLKILDIVTIILLAVATYMVFFYAPIESCHGKCPASILLPCCRRLGWHAQLLGSSDRRNRIPAKRRPEMG